MAVALYHRVMRREGFEESARILFELLKDAQRERPGESRVLFLDIDDHRNKAGGFDSEMLELQKEFVLGFLMRFLDKVHMPLMSVSNPRGQSNDMPDELSFVSIDQTEAEKADEPVSLYVENYSNTEFMSEEPVREYLKDVSAFVSALRVVRLARKDGSGEGVTEWRSYWHAYLVDLITELFNGFVLGNLISVSAMTRTLVESYAYISLFERDLEGTLLRRWYASGLLSMVKMTPSQRGDEAMQLVRKQCEAIGVSYDELKKDRRKGSDNAWLKPLIGKNRIGFADICNYLGDPAMNGDYKRACSFVHGQDLSAKADPFTYYFATYEKLYLMMDYMLKVATLLIPGEEAVLAQVEPLREKLYSLGEVYVPGSAFALDAEDAC